MSFDGINYDREFFAPLDKEYNSNFVFQCHICDEELSIGDTVISNEDGYCCSPECHEEWQDVVASGTVHTLEKGDWE